MVETLFFIALVLIMAVLHWMLMSIMWQRFVRLLRMQDARTTRVVIRAYGTDARATYRALAKHTRLDLHEIDELIEQHRTGPLPLPLGARQASSLAEDLRAAGATVEVMYQSTTTGAGVQA